MGRMTWAGSSTAECLLEPQKIRVQFPAGQQPRIIYYVQSRIMGAAQAGLVYRWASLFFDFGVRSPHPSAPHHPGGLGRQVHDVPAAEHGVRHQEGMADAEHVQPGPGVPGHPRTCRKCVPATILNIACTSCTKSVSTIWRRPVPSHAAIRGVMVRPCSTFSAILA